MCTCNIHFDWIIFFFHFKGYFPVLVYSRFSKQEYCLIYKMKNFNLKSPSPILEPGAHARHVRTLFWERLLLGMNLLIKIENHGRRWWKNIENIFLGVYMWWYVSIVSILKSTLLLWIKTKLFMCAGVGEWFSPSLNYIYEYRPKYWQ